MINAVIVMSMLVLALSFIGAPIVGVGTALGVHHVISAIGAKEVHEHDNKRVSALKVVLAKNEIVDDFYFGNLARQYNFTTKSQVTNKLYRMLKQFPITGGK